MAHRRMHSYDASNPRPNRSIRRSAGSALNSGRARVRSLFAPNTAIRAPGKSPLVAVKVCTSEMKCSIFHSLAGQFVVGPSIRTGLPVGISCIASFSCWAADHIFGAGGLSRCSTLASSSTRCIDEFLIRFVWRSSAARNQAKPEPRKSTIVFQRVRKHFAHSSNQWSLRRFFSITRS